MNVNDNKDVIHQTEFVINMNTKVNMELKCDIENRMNVNDDKDGIH